MAAACATNPLVPAPSISNWVLRNVVSNPARLVLMSKPAATACPLGRTMCHSLPRVQPQPDDKYGVPWEIFCERRTEEATYDYMPYCVHLKFPVQDVSQVAARRVFVDYQGPPWCCLQSQHSLRTYRCERTQVQWCPFATCADGVAKEDCSPEVRIICPITSFVTPSVSELHVVRRNHAIILPVNLLTRPKLGVRGGNALQGCVP